MSMTSLERPDETEAPALDVLLVDDNPEVAESLAQFLDAAGIRAKAVFSAREALVLVRSIDRIGVVVLDYCMPVTDGLELAGEIRKVRHEEDAVELILLTAHANTELVFRAVKGEFFGFHEKPCRPRVLAETVDRALRSAERRRLAAVSARASVPSFLPSAGATSADAHWSPDAVLSAVRARQYLPATRAGIRLSAIEGLADRPIHRPADVVNAVSNLVADAIELMPENSTLFLSVQDLAEGVRFAVDAGTSDAPGAVSAEASVSEDPTVGLTEARRLASALGASLIIEHRRSGAGGRFAASLMLPAATR